MRALVVLLVVVVAAMLAILPPRAIVVANPGSSRLVRGVLHVHTLRSDGTGTVDAVARAAARAGLSFVVLTDHGDGARPPSPPAYVSGVLVIDAVEISTDEGHLVAIGLPETPYPLGGEARDVVDDVHRLGGWAMAAHPGSPKTELAWHDWDAPIDGIEWLNGDSAWRDEGIGSLLRVLLTYPFRPSEALTTLLDRPVDVMERWDALTQKRQVTGLAAADAHARIGLTTPGEPYDTRASVALPSYASVFSALSVTVDGVSLTRNADVDAGEVIQAIRNGRVYSTIDGLARGGALSFSAVSGQGRAESGQRLAIDGPVTVNAAAIGPAEARITLYRNGAAFKTVDALTLEESVPAEPAVYRVEVSLPGAGGAHPVPWIVSNPIYVGPTSAPEASSAGPASTVRHTWTLDQLNAARIERSAASEGAVSTTRAASVRELLFRYALGGRPSDHPYAAAVLPVPGPLELGERIRFTAHADRPRRLSVQLRSPGPGDGDRWRRSIYLDETERQYSVGVAEMRAVGDVKLEDKLATIDSLLFVMDDLNTPLGNGGRVWIQNLEVVK